MQIYDASISPINGDQPLHALTLVSQHPFDGTTLKRPSAFQCCSGLSTKPEEVTMRDPCMLSPGAAAVVLGATAVFVWTGETLLFVGAPLGTEVAACIFVVLFPCAGLMVGNVSEEWVWMKASSSSSGFSVFPTAVKLSATGLESVVSTGGSGAEVPAWIWKGKSSFSRTELSFVLLCLFHRGSKCHWIVL